MTSTCEPPSSLDPPAWRQAGLRYYPRNFFYREKFGEKIWKVSLDGGFGCPHRHKGVITTGCIFCDPDSFSPSRRLGLESITAQLDEGIRRIQLRQKVKRFIAYFQPGTNTLGSVKRLRTLFEEAIAHPAITGLAIGTRPDCVAEPVLDLLTELAGRTWLTLEFGLQTMHDRTLDWLKRGHRYEAFLDAMRRARSRDLEIEVHIILGIPGESREDMQATANEMARLGVESVKIHNLYAVHGTQLAEMVTSGEVRLPELEDYIGYAVDFIERLPPNCVVDRISGDAPPEFLLAPTWCLDKPAIRAALDAEFQRRDTWQGKLWNPLSPVLAAPLQSQRATCRLAETGAAHDAPLPEA